VSGQRSRLNGHLLSPGGDWFLVGHDNCGRIDVRANIKTVDDTRIYVQYFGLLVLTPGVVAILEGRESADGDDKQYFFTNPRLVTGDQR
jgi:hypothetical protein